VDRNEVMAKLSGHRQELRCRGVASLSLFGSVARNEAAAGSDVDFVIEFDRPVGLFHFFELQHYLEDLLGVAKVDLVTRDAIRPAIRDRVLREAVHVG